MPGVGSRLSIEQQQQPLGLRSLAVECQVGGAAHAPDQGGQLALAVRRVEGDQRHSQEVPKLSQQEQLALRHSSELWVIITKCLHTMLIERRVVMVAQDKHEDCFEHVFYEGQFLCLQPVVDGRHNTRH